MNLLGAKLYDPAAAVSKATSALLAMTAFDTTNLRITITVPAHGMIRFKLRCCMTGATTAATVFLGVLNGATVVGRVVPLYENATANAATQNFALDAEFTAVGLTPGSTSFDAAYGVEVVVAATNIKYGGPNDTTTNNAWGAFMFEAWDPQPIPTAAPGAANGLQICGANAATTYATLTSTGAFTVNGVNAVSQTGDSFARIGAAGAGLTALGDARVANLDAAVSGRMATYTQPTGFLAATFPSGTVANTTNITAGTITTATNLTNAPTAGDLTVTMKTSVTTAATAATPTAAAVTGNVGGNVSGSVGSVVGLTPSNLDAAVSSRSTYAGADTAGTTTLLGRLTAGRAANLDGIDAAVSSRFAAASYTAPDNASITAIKAKTDSLAFAVAGKLDANILAVNGIAVTGAGTTGSPWGP